MTRYIAIDGQGGSGKTYLSGLLAEKLQAPVYHLDDYGNDYKPFVGLPKLRQVVATDASDVVIYEGVGVFDERFDALQPFRILVQVPASIKQTRIAGRDVPREGRTASDWEEIWNIWHEAEREHFVRVAAQGAHMVVGAADGQFDIDDIVARFRTCARE